MIETLCFVFKAAHIIFLLHLFFTGLHFLLRNSKVIKVFVLLKTFLYFIILYWGIVFAMFNNLFLCLHFFPTPSFPSFMSCLLQGF